MRKKEDETAKEGVAPAPQVELMNPFDVIAAQESSLLPAGLEEVAAALEHYTVTLIKEEGIAKLETTYFKEGSIFDGLEVNLHHYDSAPDAMKIALYGTPEAARMLDAQVVNLMNRLNAKMPDVKFDINPPFIKTKPKRIAKLEAAR